MSTAEPAPGEWAFERPLSARSVMASLLLGRRPAWASTRDLIRWCDLFGIAGGTARVALHRMMVRGELVARDGGYELAGRLEARRTEQEWSLRPQRERWDGEWRLAVVTAGGRAAPARAALRDAMRRLRLAERREGLWMRPDNLASEPEGVAARQCEWFRATPDADAVRLAHRLFRPDSWARRADALNTRLATVVDGLAAGGGGLVADAFVVGAAALRQVRADPLLPEALLPDPWPGPALRAEYERFRVEFGRAARVWFRTA